MSIIISNLSHAHQDSSNWYEVCINEEQIAMFIHVPSDGLAECLRQAANAVARQAGKEGAE